MAFVPNVVSHRMGEDHGATASVSRRAFLRTAGGVTALSAAAGTAAGQDGTGGTTIDMTDDLVFDPDDTTIAPGATVPWGTVGAVSHSVTAYEDQIPDGATFFASGGFESESAARSAYPNGQVRGGETFQHTFETEGTYQYFCIPHESVGMVAQLVVTSQPQQETGPTSVLPEEAKILGILVAGALASILAFAYFFMKYGGDYGGVE